MDHLSPLLALQAKSAAAPDKDKLDIKALGREFLSSSSFILMKIKQNQQRDRNVNVLLTALEKAVDWLPGVDRGTLESIVPYAVFHQACMEIGLFNQHAPTSKGGNGDHISLTTITDQASSM